MKEPIFELDSLLRALRGAGLGIGVGEELKVKHVVSLATNIDVDQLRLLVRCICVRSTVEGQTFDRIWDAWRTQIEAPLKLAIQLEDERRENQPPLLHSPVEPTNSRKPRTFVLSRRRWVSSRTIRYAGLAALAMGVVGTGVTLGAKFAYQQEPQTAALGVAAAFRLPDVSDAHRACFVVEKKFRPELAVIPPSLAPHVARGSTALASLVTALVLWFFLRRKSYLPEPLPLPAKAGPTDMALSPAKLLEPVLVERNDQETLVWGVTRFVTDEPSAKLDVRRSVEATAAQAGAPTALFLKSGEYRTVWLWVDESAEEPLIARFAEEIQRAVQQAGLPFARANFWGIPDRIVRDDGQTLTPTEMEEHNEGVAVLVLTDGRNMSLRARAVEERRKVSALFRALARWPRLAIVDFADDQHGLSAFALPHAVPVLHPDDAAVFLGEGEVDERALVRIPARLSGETLAWAAILALSPRPVDEATALCVKGALGLRGSPWAWRLLRDEGQMTGELLGFAPEKRASLLRWLVGADVDVGADVHKPVPKHSRLGRALEIWRDRYTRQIAASEQNEAEQPWQDTPAQRMLEIERLILDMWSNPRSAVAQLHERAAGEFGAVIRSHLEQYGAREIEGNPQYAGIVALPWRWSSLDAQTKVMLKDLGLGGLEMEPSRALRVPGRLGLAVGLAGGIGVLGLAGTAMNAYVTFRARAPTCALEETGIAANWGSGECGPEMAPKVAIALHSSYMDAVGPINVVMELVGLDGTWHVAALYDGHVTWVAAPSGSHVRIRPREVSSKRTAPCSMEVEQKKP